MKECTQVGCVSQDPFPRKSILREERKLGSKHAVKFSKGTEHHKKIGKERVHRLSKSVNLMSPCAPKFEERSRGETLHQERCARGVAWNLSKICTNSRKLRFLLLLKPGQCGAHFEKTRRTRIRSRFKSINAHDKQKRIELR